MGSAKTAHTQLYYRSHCMQHPSTSLEQLTGAHRAQTVLIRRDREIRIFGYFSFFMHARIISHIDFRTIHLKIITPKKGLPF